MKRTDYYKVIAANFRAINSTLPSGSTSPMHRALHKVVVQTRIKNGKYDEIGRLLGIASEHSFNNVLCGNDVVVEYEGRKYGGKLARGIARIDIREHNRDISGKKFTRNIEVLVDHPYLAYFPNSKKGRQIANDFRDYMFRKDYFGERERAYFSKGVAHAGFNNKNEEHGLRRIHFVLSDALPSVTGLDYSPFKQFVGLKSELERKYDIYNSLSDKMAFAVFLEDLPLYAKDLRDMLEKKDMSPEECKIDYFFTLKKEQLMSIARDNGGMTKVFYNEKGLEMAGKKSKKITLQIWSLEDIL